MEITKKQFKEFHKKIHELWDLYFDIMHNQNEVENKQKVQDK